jgi:hypothetical protein
VITDFFWLHSPTPWKKFEIDATCRNNRITVTTPTNLVSASVLLDGRLIDFGAPVSLTVNGQTTTYKLKPSLRVLCESLTRRGDPELAFTAKLDFGLRPPAGLSTDERNWLRRLLKAGARSVPRP